MSGLKRQSIGINRKYVKLINQAASRTVTEREAQQVPIPAIERKGGFY